MHAKPPEHITRQEKYDSRKRQQYIPCTTASACDVEKWIILDKCVRYDERAEFQNAFSVNGTPTAFPNPALRLAILNVFEICSASIMGQRVYSVPCEITINKFELIVYMQS